MEQTKLDNDLEESKMGFWRVYEFDLPNASNYLLDLHNISWATTGLINSLEANQFFDEATQMIANSIFLFRKGFFDAAFYSLRQSIEISIGTLYLNANPEKKKEWKQLKSGFESNTMVRFLQKHEPVFSDMREKMVSFFEGIRAIQKKTNKYVHKQGFLSFYATQKMGMSSRKKEGIRNKIVKDFEETLIAAIGAVAVYRLAIDPLPIILMDEELLMRSGDFITEPYSEFFVDKYIGLENVDLYKQTIIYQSYKDYLMSRERYHESVFDIIHWRIIDRNHSEEILKQILLLSFGDRLVFSIMMSSTKIPRVFLDGYVCYFSEVHALHTDVTFGSSYYDDFFEDKGDFNISYKESYLSRIKVTDKYTVIESNEPFDDAEVRRLKTIAKIFQYKYCRFSDRLQKIYNEALN